MTFSQLDAGDQKLLKLMQTIDYGRLEQFSIWGLHGNLWVNRCEIHQNPSSVKRQSGITAPYGRFYSVCHLTAART